MDLEHIVPIILAGGEGRRLRPLTHYRRPKPFLKLSGDYNILQETLMRCAGMAPPVVVCQTPYLDMVRRSIARLSSDFGIVPRAFVGEPYVRSTASAVAAGVMTMAPHMTFAVFPSNHVIDRDGPLFRAVLDAGKHVLKHGGVVSVGGDLKHAYRRCGYLHAGAPVDKDSPVLRSNNFIENPLAAEAATLTKMNDYLIDTGILVARVGDYLHEFSQIDPWYMQCVKDAFEQGLHYDDSYELNREFYHELPILSVGKGMLERTDNRYVVPFEGAWHDVSTLPTFLRLSLMRFCGMISR